MSPQCPEKGTSRTNGCSSVPGEDLWGSATAPRVPNLEANERIRHNHIPNVTVHNKFDDLAEEEEEESDSPPPVTESEDEDQPPMPPKVAKR